MRAELCNDVLWLCIATPRLEAAAITGGGDGARSSEWKIGVPDAALAMEALPPG